jgi:outer membrane protein OmpA-like peptidoglycan-associated protein
MNHGSKSAFAVRATVIGAALLMVAPFASASEAEASSRDPLPSKAGEFSLKLEPGVAFPLTSPQEDLFKTGGGMAVKGLWSLNRYLGVGPSFTYLALPARQADKFGSAWTLGGSLVLRRPHDLPDDDRFHNLSPWVDVDAMYVRTGPLNRPGFAAGAGISAPLGKARALWLGPFVRYAQIIQPERTGYDNRDAKILTVGVSLEVGPGVERRHASAAAPAQRPTAAQETTSRPDRDGDGVPDGEDRCPDVAGPRENHGCPPYQKLVVHPDKLELKEKLYFSWNQAALQEASFPALDEVVQALKDNKNFRVQVEGHASSEGGDEHNQTLSEQRADAVLDYFVAHGISKDRLVSKGFSSSVPVASNTTEAGREQNRRVEFSVHFRILDDGSK